MASIAFRVLNDISSFIDHKRSFCFVKIEGFQILSEPLVLPLPIFGFWVASILGAFSLLVATDVSERRT